MVRCGMNLREVVGNVDAAGVPMGRDEAEGGAVADPVVPHDHGLGALELHSLVGEADSGGVVANDGCG